MIEKYQTILLVEDQADPSVSCKKDLERLGYRVVTVYTGEEAVETAGKTPGIDLILMDIDLGDGMDGAQAAEQILEKHDLPLVFILSNPDPETLEKVERITSYGFVTRNSSVAEVNSFIKMAFRLFEANEKARIELDEHTRAEKALSDSEELLSRSQEIAHVGSWKLDLTENNLKWSDEVYRIFGCEPQEFAATYEAFLDFIHPNDRAEVDEAYSRSLREGTDNYEIEHRIVRQSTGEIRHVHERCVHVRDDVGTIIESIGMVHDITERKQAEEALRQNEESYSTTLRSIGDGVITTDTKGRVSYMNPVAEALCGWSGEEARGRPLPDVFRIVHAHTRKVEPDPAKKVLEKEEVLTLSNHTKLISRAGTEYQIADTAAPIRNPAGVITGVVLVFSDVTETYALREQLRISGERLDFAMSVENIGMWDWDLRANETFFDGRYYTMAGYRPNEFPGNFRGWADRVHPDDLEASQKEIEDYLSGVSGAFITEFRFRTKQGSWMWIKSKGQIVSRDEEGVPLRMIGTHIDITERKQAEEALRQNEKILRQVIDLVPHFIFAKDVHGTYLLANKAVADAYGTTPGNLLGKSDYDFAKDAEEVDFFIECDRKVMESGTGLYGIEEPITDAKGSKRFLETTRIPFTASGIKTPAVLAVSVDITERKRAAKRLQESEGILRDILENLLAGFWDWNLVDNTEYLSPTFKKMFGYEDHEMESSPEAWQRIIFQEDLPGVLDIFDQHVKSHGQIPFNSEIRYHHKDGSTVWVICEGQVIEWAEDGTPIRMVGCHIDITERKQLEEALKESEYRYRMLFENMNVGFALHEMIYNEDGKPLDYRFLDLNPMFEKLTGGKKEVFCGHTVNEVFPGTEQYWIDNYGKVAQTGEPIAFANYSQEIGRYFDIFAFSPEKDLFAVFFIDITERKLAEKALEKSLKEKNVLLSEIHHRVKNNMAVVSSLLTLQSEFDEQKKNPEKLLKDLQTRILSMAWVHELVYESNDFAQIPAGKLLQRLADYLKSSYQPDDKEISMQVRSDDIMLDMNNSIPLTLLMTEVLTNAWKHAFTGRQTGRIEVILENQEKGFRLVIRDDGVGVSDLDKVNNPESFGYTIVHGLAGQLRGELAFSSPSEGGLKVEAWFPDKTTI